MRKILVTYLPASMLLLVLAMILVTCGGGGDGSDSGTTPPPTKSVVITGTVPGTVAIAYDLSTGKEAARNVASGTPKTFTLNVAPSDYYLMFIENEGTPSQRPYAFQNVTGGNVFTCKANTTLDLGVLVFNNYPRTATPLFDPISGNDNVTETFMPEASFSPGAGEWIATRKFVNSTCSGHSPGTTVTENVTIAQGFGIVTFTPAGTTETAIGVANVNTAILTASSSALVTIYLTMQSDGSLAGTYSKVGYGGECSEDATITAVLRTPPPVATLTGLSVNGPSPISENSTATYTATARWSDNSTSTVTPTWSVNPQVVEISPGGVLSCQGGVSSDQTVTITATYSSGEITKTATMDVTITNTNTDRTTIPWQPQMLSGKVFFEENFHTGGGYDSHLYIFNPDFSFEQYSYENPPDTSHYVNGIWETCWFGDIHVFGDAGRTQFLFSLYLVSDSSTDMGVLVYYDVNGTPYTPTWEKTIPVNSALLPGTYQDNFGDTWIFEVDGTGGTTSDGGRTYRWSVESGIIRFVFPNAYVGRMYARASSQSSATSYTRFKGTFVLYTPTGDFSFYYGGLTLTRQ